MRGPDRAAEHFVSIGKRQKGAQLDAPRLELKFYFKNVCCLRSLKNWSDLASSGSVEPPQGYPPAARHATSSPLPRLPLARSLTCRRWPRPWPQRLQPFLRLVLLKPLRPHARR